MHTFIVRFVHLRPERMVASSLALTFVLSVAVYMYAIVFSVIHVVLREELTLAIDKEQAHIAELESHYLSLSAGITDGLASDMGFVAVEPAAYVPVTGENGRISRAE